ncbi:transposase [Clostridium sp. C1]|nr:transposase [Clostridium sp. C1]
MDKTKLSEALKYSINQEEKLRVYLEDGRIEISNNRAENAIRPFCVGRRYAL